MFDKLVNFAPLTPLTGDDNEWSEVLDDSGMQQNIRNSAVFKSYTSPPYWIDAYKFSESDGTIWFSSSYSHAYIKFPWEMPESQIIEVDTDDNGDKIYPEWLIKQHNAT
jgi:hypothetical protein